ncbi:Lin1244/Lin1753 domain-containing protein [Enterococcus sp. DIV1420a]|uniref:DUF4373 domain-containing protein n=1 Tax=Enterococcus sp. DIV1420a TaxID=2774672 RepID=UPI003F1F328F
MARPYKQGVDYYSVDVDFLKDIKYRKIRKSCGPQTCEILLCLLGYIYGDMGYFLRWDEDSAFLVTDDVGAKEGLVKEVVTKAVQVGFFDHDKYQKYKILTSNGIQKRYKLMTSKRKEVVMQEEYLVIDGNNPPSTVVKGVDNTQRERESKRESKVKKTSCKYSDEHLRLAEKLKNNLIDDFPSEMKKVKIEKWADVFRLIEKQDKQSIEAVDYVLDWLPTNQFWFGNIRSASKFRAQFEKLKFEIKKEKERAKQPKTHYRQQPIRQESKPEWLDKPREDEKVSEEKQADLKRQIQELSGG